MQQIAKMFATLGFNVDSSGLDTFKLKLRDVRGDMALLARNAKVLQNNFNGVSKALQNINDKLKIKKADSKLSATYVDLKNAVQKVDKAFQSITRNQPHTTRGLGKIHSSIIFGEKRWKTYADQVQRTRDLLRDANREMTQLRANSTVRTRVNINGGSGGRGGAGRNGNGGRTTFIPFGFGGNAGRGESSWLGGIAPFFRSMSPATAIGGGLAAAGFATKEVVQGGRDMQKMQNIMTSATESQQDYATAMEYVRKESNRLGQSTLEMGMGFAKVLQSAQGKMTLQQTQKLFTGFGELMTVFGSSVEDQQGVYRALGQMLSKGKVEAEEVGQLAERGISREVIKKAAERRYGLKNAGDYEKYQKAGKVKIPEIADELSKVLSEMANRNGALEKSLNNSRVAQERFNNRLMELKLKILEGGLDKSLAILFENLTKLVDVVEDLGTGIGFVVDKLKELKTITNEYVDDSTLLGIAIAVITGLLLRKTKTFKVLIRFARTGKSVFEKLALFFRGGMFKAIVFLGSRIFWLTALLTTLISVGSALNDKMQGKTTWIDLWAAKIDLLANKWEAFKEVVEYNSQNMDYMLRHPIDAYRNSKKGDGTVVKEFLNGVSKSVLTPLPASTLKLPTSQSNQLPAVTPNVSKTGNTGSEGTYDQMKNIFNKQLSSMSTPLNIYLDGQSLLSKNLYLFGNSQQYDLNG